MNIAIPWSLDVLTDCSISVPPHPCALHFLWGSSRQPASLSFLWEAYHPGTGLPLYTRYPKYLLCVHYRMKWFARLIFPSPFHRCFSTERKLVRFMPFIQNSVLPFPVSSVSNTEVTQNCIWKHTMKLLFSARLQATLADPNPHYGDRLFSKGLHITSIERASIATESDAVLL